MQRAIYYINTLIQKLNYTSYCEIGYAHGGTFAEIECAKKIAVDPAPLSERPGDKIIKKTSDNYFETATDDFDIYFIDGDHSPDQVFKDVQNCLEFLSPRGVLILHDICPINEDDCHPRGCDEAYKAFLKIRTEIPDISAYILEEQTPDPCGYGIVFKQPQNMWHDILMVDKHYYMCKNKKKLMQPRNLNEIINLLKERNKKYE